MKSYINKSTVKGFILPINGFYQSHIGYDLESQLESHVEYISETDSAKGEQMQEWLDTADLSYAYKSIFNLVSSQLVEFMQDRLNDEYGTSIHFYNVEYQPMTMMNTGDNIYAHIEVKDIPSIELLSIHTGLSITELFSELQTLSDSKLKSVSGFSSFYNHDLAPLKGIDLLYWESAYVSLIIDFLVNDYFGSPNDMELAYLEDSLNHGGMLETFLQCLSHEDLETFNSFETDY